MHNEKKRSHKIKLTIMFSACVFAILFITIILVFTVMYLLYYFGIISSNARASIPIVSFSLFSLLIGTVLSMFLSRRPLAPVNDIMNAADKIASGDYSVRIDLKGPEEFRQLNNRFNHMAEELGSVEMLRSDFVNNFSHEFKTPIVSIQGFAKMLKRDDLTQEERDEYLDIIIDESQRLTELSTNILNLSKLTKQTILTNQTRINVSEQIRQVIALLSDRWLEKKLNFDFDCSETYLTCNEELLEQVWINLIGNAVKFTPTGGNISIRIAHEPAGIRFIFTNDGCSLTEEKASHIFDKFYQGDTSHTEKGNGLGLTIAKRIVELHQGTIEVQTAFGKETTFVIVLPEA